MLVKEGYCCLFQLKFDHFLEFFVVVTISMLCVLSVLSSGGLLNSNRADFSIKISSFDSFGGAVGVKVQLDEEVESFNHVSGVSAIVDKCPGLMLDPTGKAGDGSISEWANGVGCCHSLDRLIGARDGFSKGNFMV